MNLKLLDQQGKNAGEVKALKKVFEVPKNEALVHNVLTWYLASRRSGTHATKKRGEVSGGGKKPWKQKGTGRARAGSIRSPLWRHGGVTFGPQPRKYGYALPKKMRKKALAILLSDRAREEKLFVIEAIKLASPKTREMAKLIEDLKLSDQRILLIADEPDRNLELACRNLEGLKLCLARELNIYDLLRSEVVVLEKKAVKALEGALG